MHRAQLQAEASGRSWRMLSIEEVLPFLDDGQPPLPSLEDLACILHKCSQKRKPEYALRLHAYLLKRGLETQPSLGTYLVSLLVDFNSLPHAQLAFDNLAHPSQWCYQSLITGYIKSGKLQHALTLYLRMCEHNYLQPNAPMFVSIIRACTKLNDVDTGLHIHVHAARMGLIQTNLFVGSALVNMYAKCGFIAKAREVFDSVSIRDVVLWTALVAGYIENGFCEEALECFEQMCLDSISPNATTFVCILKACGSRGVLHKGQEIHVEIARQGILNTHQAVGNALVNMYAKCGVLDKAHEVLNRLPCRDVVCWTALMIGYVEHGHDSEALACFDQMQLEGIAPNTVTFVCSIKACTNLEAIETGQEIHAEIERQELPLYVVGCALVDMYAKWGLFAKARQIFDRLSFHDIDLWNVLIAGYIGHAYDKEALKCLQSMLEEGIHPDGVTFVYGLKACGSIGNVCKGQELHAEIERRKLLDKDLVLGNTLVDMYAKCGCFVLASEVFRKLPAKDAVSWTALIEGYAEHGHGEEALKCFEQMQLAGVSPNSVTLICSLKACGNIRAIRKGQALHAAIERLGLSKGDPFVCNSVIDMYAKCDFLLSACHVFHQLPVHDVVSWTALIAGYTENGHGEEALLCIEQMQLEGTFLNAATISCGLKACGILGAINKGCQMHVVVETQGLLERDSIVSNALVDMYVKFGSLECAQKAFNRVPNPNAISGAALIAGYAGQGQGEQALECYNQLQVQGVFSDAALYVCCLKACGRVGVLEKGQEIHAEIERLGMLETDVAIGSTLVDMYARSGSLQRSQEVFDKLPVRNEVSWNALITGYTGQKHCEKAIKCFAQMQLEGVAPNIITFVCILKACGSIGARDKGQELHDEIQRRGFLESNLFAGSALVDVYAKCGFLSKAQLVFAKLPYRDTVSWNTAITAFVVHKQFEEALKCFEQMQHKGVSANAVTFICSLKACSGIGALGKGQEIHTQMERQGFLENDLVVSALVNMYAKCKMLVEAHQVIDKLPLGNVVCWTALMTGYVQLGNYEMVFQVLNCMLGQGVKPDSISFIVLLSACSHACMSNKCSMYFEAMSKDYGIFPTHDHLAWVLQLSGRAGHPDTAIEVAKRMPFCRILVPSHIIRSACRNWGNVVFGKLGYSL